MAKYYLAADLGSSNVKLVLGSLNGDGRLTLREAGRMATPKLWVNGHLCINVYEIYGWICRVLEQLCSETGFGLESLGVDSWVSDFALVSPWGDMIGLPVFYRDARTMGMMDEIEKVVSYERLYELTTQRRIQESTLAQLLALKQEHPELLQQGNRMLCLGDLLMYFFTGHICSEISAASYSQMFSMKKGAWENEVFDMFGIPRTIQPPIVQAGDFLGRLTREQALKYRTNRFSVITPAVHDTASACVAVPADETKNWVCIATGSWYLVSMERDTLADPALCCHYNLSNTGLAFGKILLKRNVCAMWIIQECRKSWERMGLSCEYSEIARLAEETRPFAAFIDTDAECFYNPDDMPEAIVSYLERTGQEVCRKDEIGKLARIVYESISYKCLYSLRALEKVTGKTADILYTVGGASHVAFLNLMLASVTGLTVIAGPAEATAAGNILLQAMGAGELSGEAQIREIVKTTFPQEIFYPKKTEQWQQHYPAFLELCGLEKI